MTINYPRKCKQCEYIANNASMYHYHKKTHLPIPNGQLCDYNCGQHAQYRGTGGKYTCESIGNKCPKFRKEQSQRVKKQWADDDGSRAASTKKLFEELVVFNDVARTKNLNSTAKRRIIKAGDAKDYRSYARKCRRVAQQWARENGHKIGKQTYHVDHRLSLVDAYNAELDVEIASHPVNLRVVPAKENSRKGAKSEISLEELLEEIKQYG